MKRLLALTLALCLLCGLAACSKAEERSETLPVQSIPVELTTAAPPASTAAPSTEPVQTDAPPETPPATEPQKSVDIGTVANSVYLNEMLDWSFTLPEGWRFLSDEEIALQTDLTTSMLQDKLQLAEIIEKNGQLMVMNATEPNTGSSVNLIIQPNNSSYNGLTDNQLEQQMQQAGFTIDSVDISSVGFRGRPKDCLRMSGSFLGAHFEELQLFFNPGGDYVGIVTVTLLTQDNPAMLVEQCMSGAASPIAGPVKLSGSSSPGGNTNPAAPADGTPAFGRVENGVYVNEFLGLSCTLPASWSFYTDEDLAAANGVSKLPEKLTEMLDANEQATLLGAKGPGLIDSMNLMIQAFPAGLESVDDATFLNLASASVKSELEEQGMENVKVEITDLPFCGEQHACNLISMEIVGMEIYVVQALIRVNGYAAILTVGAESLEDCQAVLDGFAPLS